MKKATTAIPLLIIKNPQYAKPLYNTLSADHRRTGCGRDAAACAACACICACACARAAASLGTSSDLNRTDNAGLVEAWHRARHWGAGRRRTPCKARQELIPADTVAFEVKPRLDINPSLLSAGPSGRLRSTALIVVLGGTGTGGGLEGRTGG